MTTTPLAGGVLVASASTSLREQVRHSFDDRRWPVQEALGGADALVKLETGDWQLLFLDRRLPDLDAEELIQIIKRRFPGIEVVLVDSDGGRPLPLCTPGKSPAQTNWQNWPLSAPLAEAAAESAPQPPRPAIEPLPGMIGRSAVMQRFYRLARLIAPRPNTVLLLGPTGSGKELAARAIHQLSPRASRPLVVVNCAAIPESLLESELFGYARGAFTGAVQAYSGRIPAAQGGTLFLDEVGELPLGLQAKLLRFLDQKEVQRLGSSEVSRADVRLVAATNADLEQRVDKGSFRGDLYFRLSAFPLELPALADRQGDVIPLAEHFLASGGGKAPRLSAEAAARLASHAWPGNVRELQHLIERASILAEDGPEIRPEHLYFLESGRGWRTRQDVSQRGQVLDRS